MDEALDWRADFEQFVSNRVAEIPRLIWSAIQARVNKLATELDISTTLRILLSTDGSVTGILEALTGHPIRVSTRVQRECTPAEFPAKTVHLQLKISRTQPVNFREVWLVDQETRQKLAFCISLTPLNRLEAAFREDLMRADVPIGKLMWRYKIESRREIFEIGSIRDDARGFLTRAFKVATHARIPFRYYNIIRDDAILMRILEYFHPLL